MADAVAFESWIFHQVGADATGVEVWSGHVVDHAAEGAIDEGAIPLAQAHGHAGVVRGDQHGTRPACDFTRIVEVDEDFNEGGFFEEGQVLLRLDDRDFRAALAAAEADVAASLTGGTLTLDLAVREVFDASLELGAEALKTLGLHPFKVEKMARAFRRHDETGLDQLYHLWDENPDIARNRAFLSRAKEHGESLKEMMEADRLQLHDRSERGWTPPPKDYIKDLTS